MSDSAAVLRSSLEKTNYTKLSRLIIDGGTLALQKVLNDAILPPANLHAALKTNLTTLQALKKKKILSKNQWNLLFPPGGAPPDAKQFDITLTFLLIRNICGILPPASGWNSEPPAADKSFEANLVRVKFFRNELGHVPTTAIDTPSFENQWLKVSDALVRLGLGWSEIDRLKNTPIDEGQVNTCHDMCCKSNVNVQEEKNVFLVNKYPTPHITQEAQKALSPLLHYLTRYILFLVPSYLPPINLFTPVSSSLFTFSPHEHAPCFSHLLELHVYLRLPIPLRKTVEDGDGNFGKTIKLITDTKKRRTWICEIKLMCRPAFV